MSISGALPMAIQPIFKGVHGGCINNFPGCINNFLRKTVPGVDHTLTKKVLSDIETTSVDSNL